MIYNTTCPCLKPQCGTQSAVNFSCDNDGRDVEFIALTEFLPRVTLVAKGVPDDVALEYLRQSAFTLARDSLLLKRDVRLDVQADVRDYYLTQSDAEQVHYVHRIIFGKPLKYPEKWRDLSYYRVGFRNQYVQFEPNDKIVLNQTPKQDAENQLHVQYFAVPTQNACVVDKLLYDRYQDVVVNGALADLLLMRQYPFADPQLAAFYLQKFKQGIAHAKIDVEQQFNTQPQTFNQWGKI